MPRIPYAKIERASNISTWVAMALSLIILLAWLFDLKGILDVMPNSPAMKFNTALLLLICGWGVRLTDQKKHPSKIGIHIIFIFIILVGVTTLFEHILNLDFHLDHLIVQDHYSDSHPGRMSFATDLCFLLFGVSLLGVNAQLNWIKRFTQYILFTIICIAMVAIIAFVLEIPGHADSNIFNTMTIHAGVLFLILAGALSLKNATRSTLDLLFGSNAGSRLIRIIAPYNFIMIVIFGFFFLYVVNVQKTEINFAMTFYTVMAVVAALSVVFITGAKFNNTDKEKERLEVFLQSSNQEMSQFKYALDESSLIDVTNPQGEITYVNDKFCEISKMSREELIGKTHSILNSSYHSKEFFRDLWNQISIGKVWMGGIKNKAKDGSYFWVHTAIIPFKNENGKIYQYLSIRQDITKLTLLSSQYENLKLKTKEIEQFTYIASHDLQEPLRTVTSMIQILQEDHKESLNEEAVTCLNFVLDATDRMSNLIKGLLDYSRIGGGKELNKVDLNKVLKHVEDDLAGSVMKAKAKITRDFMPTLPAYHTEIRLLFQNLVSNAIKFRRKDTIPEIHIGVEEMSDFWKFFVSDNGIGISEKNKRDAFAIFQRLNNHKDYEGTGIGLAHCEKIVHLHGGEIWVDSTLNEGSTFYFTISKHLE